MLCQWPFKYYLNGGPQTQYGKCSDNSAVIPHDSPQRSAKDLPVSCVINLRTQMGHYLSFPSSGPTKRGLPGLCLVIEVLFCSSCQGASWTIFCMQGIQLGRNIPPSQNISRPYILYFKSFTRALAHSFQLLIMADKRVSDEQRYQLRLSLPPHSLHRATSTLLSMPHCLHREVQLMPIYAGRTQALAHRMQYQTFHLTHNQKDESGSTMLPVLISPSRSRISPTQKNLITMLQKSPWMAGQRFRGYFLRERQTAH